jgi:hypothetical protein
MGVFTVARFVYEDIREHTSKCDKRFAPMRRNMKVNEAKIGMLMETRKKVYVIELKVKGKSV